MNLSGGARVPRLALRKTRATAASAPVAMPPITMVPIGEPAAPLKANLPRRNFTGTYVKDTDASQIENYGKALDLMKVSGLQKTAAQFLRDLEIEHDDEVFRLHFRPPVPALRVTEQFKMGEAVELPRRDLRPGTMVAEADHVPESEALQLTVRWAAPHPGVLIDNYYFPDGELDKLHVRSVIIVEGVRQEVLQVYRRRQRRSR